MPVITVDGQQVFVKQAKGRQITDRDRAEISSFIRAMNESRNASFKAAFPEDGYERKSYGMAEVELRDEDPNA